MFFIVSKLFWLVADPINFIILLGLLGLVLSFGRTKRLGHALTGLALILLAVAGFSPAGALLLRPLEDRFPPPPANMPTPTGIIVLGGAMDAGLSEARGVPTLLQPGARLTEGAVLARRFPKARLVFTGGAVSFSGKGMSEAPAVRALWLSLGVPAEQMSFEEKSRNTWENATFAKALIDPKPDETWLLVTSAWHMPRAMGIFRKVGFRVIAYPVDYATYDDRRDFRVPRLALDAMTRLDNAMHEWIGLIAYHLAGKTDAWFPAPRG